MTITGLIALARVYWPVIAAVALCGLLLLAVQCEEADDKRNQDLGAAKVERDSLRETIERTEKASEARDEVERGGSNARYDQCLRTARTPSGCERLRELQAD